MRTTFFALTVMLAACGSNKQLTRVNESEIGVPQNIADKFAAKEAVDVAPQSAPAPATLASAPELSVKGKKGKKSKATTIPTAPVTHGKKVHTWPNRWNRPQPFFPGERTMFDVTYMGITAGSLEVKVLPYKFIGDRKVFHLQGIARSNPVFAMFYRLTDMAESYMDYEALLTHKFVIKIDESVQQRDIVELYDQKARKMYFWDRLDHKKKGKSQQQFEITMQENTQDVFSATFYLRTLPLKDGDVYTFPVVTNGKAKEVVVTVMGREKLNTKAGEFNAIKVWPQTKFEGVLEVRGASYVWISDDEHRAILKIDAKAKIGSVIAYLKELEYGKPDQNIVQPQ